MRFPHGIRKLVFGILLLFSSILVGSLGYMYFEDYSMLDALYMTLITLSTVGFGTIAPLSDSGKLFTIFLIVVNFSLFAYVLSTITIYIFEGELNRIFKNLIFDREVKKMKDHIIVCGYGRNGSKACEELKNNGQDFVLVEMDPNLFDHVPEKERPQTIIGDATQDEVLKKAGIDRAKAIITTLPKDADNVFIVLTARELNPNVTIIARASEANTESKLFRAGAHKVVMPDNLGGRHMAQLITKPIVIEFLDVLNGVGDSKMELEEFSYEQFDSEYQGLSLKDLDIRNQTGATIVGFKDNINGLAFNPSADLVIGPGDTLIVLGTQTRIDQFKKYYGNH